MITVSLLLDYPDRDPEDPLWETIANKQFEDKQSAATYVGKLRSMVDDVDQTARIVEVHHGD